MMSIDMLPDPAIGDTNPKRRTGRTVAGMLKAIAYALDNPDEWVPFHDHWACNHWWAHEHAKQIAQIITALGLRMDVRINRTTVEVQSPITRVRRAGAAKRDAE